jgi:hypothetical protein
VQVGAGRDGLQARWLNRAAGPAAAAAVPSTSSTRAIAASLGRRRHSSGGGAAGAAVGVAGSSPWPTSKECLVQTPSFALSYHSSGIATDGRYCSMSPLDDSSFTLPQTRIARAFSALNASTSAWRAASSVPLPTHGIDGLSSRSKYVASTESSARPTFIPSPASTGTRFTSSENFSCASAACSPSSGRLASVKSASDKPDPNLSNRKTTGLPLGVPNRSRKKSLSGP